MVPEQVVAQRGSERKLVFNEKTEQKQLSDGEVSMAENHKYSDGGGVAGGWSQARGDSNNMFDMDLPYECEMSPLPEFSVEPESS